MHHQSFLNQKVGKLWVDWVVVWQVFSWWWWMAQN